ncbi:MAG: aminotransferase class V-fold PLP-dependent enzyme [Imperialibacter sp.]|uniref:aminotransferase class V-fold PLP-dependent enzyme n=1 Tax=Imperialibacter sp. TaxID=2038411 RepID=UPI0032ED71F1
MSNRRSFLRRASKSAIGISAIPFLSTAPASFQFPTAEGEAYWTELRKAFPLQDKRVYFNNGTFGPSPTPVLDTIKKYLDETNSSGEYGHTDKAREVLATFVGVKTEELSLTHNTTEGINIVTWGLPLKAGDEVIVTLHEHVGNALPWLNRAKLHGIVLKPFEPAMTADENLARIKALVTPKTKVIAIPHITCTTGLVLPIKEITAWARSKSIFTAIDGAHGSGTFNLNLRELGCDFYATSCHKWMLGPNGTGFLYVREELLDTLQAYQVGAYSDTGWDLYSNPPQMGPNVPTAHRFDYGSQSKPMYMGAAASAEFHSSVGKEKIENRVKELSSLLFDGLSQFKQKLNILTPVEEASRICMITFKPKNIGYKEFNTLGAKASFRLRVVPESHLDAIRVSTHIYNSKAEVERFVEFVGETL